MGAADLWCILVSISLHSWHQSNTYVLYLNSRKVKICYILSYKECNWNLKFRAHRERERDRGRRQDCACLKSILKTPLMYVNQCLLAPLCIRKARQAVAVSRKQEAAPLWTPTLPPVGDTQTCKKEAQIKAWTGKALRENGWPDGWGFCHVKKKSKDIQTTCAALNAFPLQCKYH